MLWRTERWDMLLARWIKDYQPDLAVEAAVIYWLMDLRKDPDRPDVAPVPTANSPLFVADIPGTGVSFAFLVLPDETEPPGVIVGLLLEPH